MVSNTTPEVILWDRLSSPNAQKCRNLLNIAGIPYQTCDQPLLMPRPILNNLGITYRRIPVNSIGKDFYCDTRTFLDAVQSLFPDRALPTSPADHAFESFGYRSFFIGIQLMPVNALSPELKKDREELFQVLQRPDYADMRPSALAEVRSLCDMVEEDFLSGGGPWIYGSKCGMADINASWAINWILRVLRVENEKGLEKDAFPKLNKWLDQFPVHTPENEPRKLGGEEATQRVLSLPYAAPDVGVDENDPTGLQTGTMVSLEATDDAKPGNNPQHGKLVGLSKRETVIELKNGIRLHFPRVGFLVKKL